MAPNTSRVISGVLGALALLSVAATVTLFLLIRDHDTVISALPLTPANAASKPPPDAVKLDPNGFASTTLGPDTLDPAVASLPYPTTANTVSASPSVVPVTPPGYEDLDTSKTYPLKHPPRGVGWCALTPDASQFFSTYLDDFSYLIQYHYNGTEDKDKFKYVLLADENTSPDNNRLLIGDKANFAATAVGCIGQKSLVMSDDGQRMYVGYQFPFMQRDLKEGSPFPFFQVPGSIGVFTRPVNPYGAAQGTLWVYDERMEMVNPFGAQVAGLRVFSDPYSGVDVTGDDFGQLIRVSFNRTNSRRMVASRANYGLKVSDGALVAIYEENDLNQYQVVGIVTCALEGQTFSTQEKQSFARGMDLGDNALLASVYGFDSNGVKARGVLYFRRTKQNQWQAQSLIEAPSTSASHLFGASIVMSPDGKWAVIGAPPRGDKVSENGDGFIYLYQRNDDELGWSLKQTLQDSSNKLAFGAYLVKDKQFLVIGVSSNQINNVAIKLDEVKQITPVPRMVFLSMDQKNGKLSNLQVVDDVRNQPSLSQPKNPAGTDYNDPTFGAGMSIEIVDQKAPGTLRVVASSPLNQYIVVRSMQLL